MKTLVAVLIAIFVFAIFMLPGLVVLWLSLLQGSSFEGTTIFFVILLFVLGCGAEAALLEDL